MRHSSPVQKYIKMVLTYQLKYKQLSSTDNYQSVETSLRNADFDTEDQLQSGLYITPLLFCMPEAVCSFEDQEASVGVQEDVEKCRAYFWVHGNVGTQTKYVSAPGRYGRSSRVVRKTERDRSYGEATGSRSDVVIFRKILF